MWFNLSNIFTILRILITPFIVVSIINHSWLLALLLFALASITDFLDGYIARVMNLATPLGALLDPLADKILLLSCFVALVIISSLPAWFVILMLVREAIIIFGVIVIQLYRPHLRLKPTIWGKLNTCISIAFILFNLICFHFNFLSAIKLDIVFFLVSIFAVFSLLHYIKIGIKLLK